MIRTYGIQLCNFGASAAFPSAIGSIWSYAQLNEDVKKNYDLLNVFWENLSTEDVVSQIEDPEVVFLSLYTWNWPTSFNIINQIKSKYPECLIIAGGPEPQYSTEWMKMHPNIDLVIPYYGEVIFTEVLLENLGNRDFNNLDGILTKDVYNTKFKVADFKEIPSPYLNGFFEGLLNKVKDKYARYGYLNIRATFESNRGCPYTCTFCDIGHKEYGKVRRFGLETGIKELEWIVKNRIKVIDVADANFGMFPRDEQYIDTLIDLKEKHKWDGRFIPTWSKGKGTHILKLAKKLIDNDLDAVFGMSLQSIHQGTLDAVERTNAFKLPELSELSGKLKEDKIALYTELIFPMPNDTLENFRDGIFQVLDMEYPFEKFQINQLRISNNTRFTDPEYVKKYNIKWATIKGYTRHYTGDVIEDLISISNSTISEEEVFEGLFFSKYFVIPFYFYGIVQTTANTLHKEKIISRPELFKQIEQLLLQQKWFIDFKAQMKEHYLSAINNFTHMGYNGKTFYGCEDQDDQYFTDFSISHFTYLKNNIYDLLSSHFTDYNELIEFDRYSLWSGSKVSDEVEFKKFNKGVWLFEDDRDVELSDWLHQLYIIGRFNDSWRRNTIKKLGEVC